MNQPNQPSPKSAEEVQVISDDRLRKLAKIACNGNQHAMRYNVMLQCCFRMGEMVAEEITKHSPRYVTDEEIDAIFPIDESDKSSLGSIMISCKRIGAKAMRDMIFGGKK